MYFGWKRECFLLLHVELNPKFILMTKEAVTLDRPKVGTGFSVICGFCQLRLLRFALNFSSEIFTPHSRFPPWSGFSEFVVSLTILLYHLRLGIENISLLSGVNTSASGWISDASISSNSSMSARIFPFQIPPANNAYPRDIPGKTFQIGGALTGLLKKSDNIPPWPQRKSVVLSMVLRIVFFC